MAKPTSILGSVELKQIKLGAGRLFRGTSASVAFAGTAKFDTNTPGTSWEDMKCIAQDATINASADMYRYSNGVPSTFKKGFITGRQTQLNVTFDEFRSRVVQTALGLNNPINKLGAQEYVAGGTPTSTVILLDTVTGLSVGDELVFASATGGLPASVNSGIIDAINTLTVTMREPLLNTPVSGWKAKERVSTKLCFGGSDVATYPLLFVVDFVLDKKQFVVHINKASSAGNFAPNMGGGSESAKVGVAFDCYGVYDSDLDDNVLASFFMFEDEQ